MPGVCNAFGYTLDWQQRYRLIKAAGFDSVMLWWSDGFGRGPGYRQDVRRARNAGLVVENIHTPVQWQNDLSCDGQAGEAVAELYRNCVMDCAHHQAPVMVVHLPGDAHPLGSLGMDRVKSIVELAEKHQVRVAMENIFNTQNLVRVLEEADCETVGFCYDSCHHANDPHARRSAGKIWKQADGPASSRQRRGPGPASAAL